MKVVQFAVPEEPESSLKRKVKEDKKDETQKLEHAERVVPTKEPETAESQKLVNEPNLEVVQHGANAGLDTVVEQPEPSLSGTAKEDPEIAQLERSLKGLALTDAEGTDEPKLKTSRKEKVTVKAAEYAPIENTEIHFSHEKEVEKEPEQKLAEEPEKAGQEAPAEEPEKVEESLANEPKTVGHIVSTEQQEKVEPSLAEEPENVEPTEPAEDPVEVQQRLGEEPEKVGHIESTDEPMKVEQSLIEEPEKNEQMVVDEPDPEVEQEKEHAADQMEWQPVDEQTYADFLAELQTPEAQQRAENDEEWALALSLHAAMEQQDRADTEAAERMRQEQAWIQQQAHFAGARQMSEEEVCALQAAFAARLQIEGDTHMTAQQAAEPVFAEGVNMLDTTPSYPNAAVVNAQDPVEAEMSDLTRVEEEDEDDDTSITSEDIAWLNADIPFSVLAGTGLRSRRPSRESRRLTRQPNATRRLCRSSQLRRKQGQLALSRKPESTRELPLHFLVRTTRKWQAWRLSCQCLSSPLRWTHHRRRPSPRPTHKKPSPHLRRGPSSSRPAQPSQPRGRCCPLAE